jgi:hypothetical protein
MLELLLEQLRERDIQLYLVRVFYQARRVLDRAGYIEELGDDHMWHSISAGVQAAKAQTNVKGKAHPQVAEADEDLFSYPDTDERIAVDDDPAPVDEMDGEATKPGKAPEPPKAPKGGYQDPDRSR